MNNPLNNSLIRFMAGVYVVCAASAYTGCGEKGKLPHKKDIPVTIDAVVQNNSKELFEKKYENTSSGCDLLIKEVTVSGEEIEFKYTSLGEMNVEIKIKKDGCTFSIGGGLNMPVRSVYVWTENRVLHLWREKDGNIQRAVGKEYIDQFSDAELESMFFVPSQKKLNDCIDQYGAHITEAYTVFKGKKDAESKGFKKAVDLLKNF